MKTLSFQLRALAPTDRRVCFVASTADLDTCGTRIRPRGCRLDRFRAAGSLPLLYNHERDPANVLGRVVEVAVFDDRVEAVGEFRQSARADEVLQLIRDGIIRGCSIGFCDEVTEPRDDGSVDVVAWTLAELSVCPVQSNPHALAVRSLVITSRPQQGRDRTLQMNRAAAPTPPTRGTRTMNAAEILAKLGLKEGAGADEVAAALIKYLAGGDAEADKLAVLKAVMAMMAPAPSSSSASDGAKAAAAEAMADEVRKLQGRLAELEGQKAEAESPEARAAAAIDRGQWPAGQRSALVKQYAAGREALLFAEGYFSQRSERYVVVGAGRKPTIEAPSAKTGVAGIFSAVEKQLAGKAD